ncbi:heme o synthase [Pseudoalteromonas sp. MMG013]|uniref:heme o synthase n=1 Tax=Pseudoalteromonas sp. MMG013 TaxID=2822687 RepID=UPI001B38441F|nr:heme o synthase [Pseudoalteromonas sp. MMG013]MBQ4862533.1 heme o synthase [Pseudoalteromonas sp. MMG013]
MFKEFLVLTKPGIIMGNLIATVAGYFLAAQGDFQLVTLLAVCIGTSAVIASGCVFNNVIDQDIDKLMQRTQNRALVKKVITSNGALLYATLLGAIGFGTLGYFTTGMAVLFAVIGFAVYVGLYSLHYKRKSVYGTLIGSISGACPPVIGYCAVTAQFDVGALVILLTFCLWQIPHSYAIAIYRFEDYKAANIPVLPLVNGIESARKHMVAYIVAFTLMALALFVFNYVGTLYAVSTLLIGVVWLAITIVDFGRYEQHIWAKRVFLVSILAITSLSVFMSLDFVSLAPQTLLTVR